MGSKHRVIRFSAFAYATFVTLDAAPLAFSHGTGTNSYNSSPISIISYDRLGAIQRQRHIGSYIGILVLIQRLGAFRTSGR